MALAKALLLAASLSTALAALHTDAIMLCGAVATYIDGKDQTTGSCTENVTDKNHRRSVFVDEQRRLVIPQRRNAAQRNNETGVQP